MIDVRIPMAALSKASEGRPAGYLDDVLSKASRRDDSAVYIPADQYRLLVRKYSRHGPPPTQGPGTELKILLKTIGIEAKPGCKCNKRAQMMDEMGCDWCAANIDTISAWLAEEAERRSLPYAPSAGKLLIKWAISRARKGNKQQGD